MKTTEEKRRRKSNGPCRRRQEDKTSIWILYGTHTGNSQFIAGDAAEKLEQAGWQVQVTDMGDFNPESLKHIHKMLVIVSTDGDGEPPLMAEDLLEYLYSGGAPKLDHMAYSVLALGDSGYDLFCQAGKDFDGILDKLGAKRISDRMDCDVDYDDNYSAWLSGVMSSLQLTGDNRFVLN